MKATIRSSDASDLQRYINDNPGVAAKMRFEEGSLVKVRPGSIFPFEVMYAKDLGDTWEKKSVDTLTFKVLVPAPFSHWEKWASTPEAAKYVLRSTLYTDNTVIKPAELSCSKLGRSPTWSLQRARVGDKPLAWKSFFVEQTIPKLEWLRVL